MTEINEILENYAFLIDKVIEKYLPRKITEDSVVFHLNRPRFAYNLPPLNLAIADPIWDFLDRGGKRWRPALFLMICEALGKNPKDFVDFAIMAEVIHNGVLIVDDVMDASEFRRGKPCTHKIYGLDVAINAGNAMYYLALQPLIQNKEKFSSAKLCEVYEVYVQEMINLSLGQTIDIAWHRGCVSVDELDEKNYLQMCAYKTGTLARMGAKFAAILVDANETLVEKIGNFAEALGIAFQIQDDVIDLKLEKFQGLAFRGRDITEGKISLAVIHTLRIASAKDKKRVLKILNMHTSDQNLIDEAISILEKYDSTKYALGVSRTLVEQSWHEVDTLLPPSKAKENIRAFANFLLKRRM